MNTPSIEELQQELGRGLLAAAAAQDRGDIWAIDDGFDEFEARIAANAPATAQLATVLRFWDGWIDARNHDWQYYDPIMEADWPILARQVAAELSSSAPLSNEIVLREFGPANERTRVVAAVPIRGWVRVLSAVVGTVIGVTGLGQMLFGERHLGLAFFLCGWGALMWFPVFARPPRSRVVAAANQRRVAIAMASTFALSMLAYGASYLVRHRYFPVQDSANVARQVGNVGSALWLVMFVLLFFVAYYQAQTRCSTRGDDDPESRGA